MRAPLLVVFFFALGAAPVAKPTLVTLPKDKIEGMAKTLAHGDVALMESTPAGGLKQITVMTLVRAPLKVVHDVVADVGKYREFVSNMSQSDATKNADGSVDLSFVIRYTIVGFNGIERHRFREDGAIDLESTDPEDRAIFRWELYSTPAGTILVMYGFTDVLHSPGIIRGLVEKVPRLEHGLALATQLVQVRAMKQRAESLRSGAVSSFQGAAFATPSGFDFLLDRGQVVLLRYDPTGKISDLAVMDRVNAPIAKVSKEITSPGHEVKRTSDAITYTEKIDLSIASWESRYVMHVRANGATSPANAIDIEAIDGDLSGARYRWELSAVEPERTSIMLRAKQNLGSSSLPLRALFGQEPLFEPGFGAALGLIAVDGVRAHTEGVR